jgi:pimeloyl-ACP methyl ester carboxylesterase
VARFVLVHGAFRGGWAWDRVQPFLVGAGHSVEAPTLTQSEPASLGRWARQVADVLREGTADALLVGHSQGGVVALAAAALEPDRVARLVLLDAPVPEPGQSAAEVLPADVRAAYGDPPPDAWLPPTPTGDPWVDAQLVPAPAAPAFEPVDPEGRAKSVETTYVFCARTPAAYPAVYSRAAFDRTQRGYRILEADHDAPLLQPAAVATLLMDLAASGPVAGATA